MTVTCFQLQGARPAHAGRHHGHVDLQRAGLRQREGRTGHEVHLDASGEQQASVVVTLSLCVPGSLLGHHHHDLGGLRGHLAHNVVWKTGGIRSVGQL